MQLAIFDDDRIAALGAAGPNETEPRRHEMHTDRRNRCDQILELIDRCLADCERSRPVEPSPSEQSSRRAVVAGDHI